MLKLNKNKFLLLFSLIFVSNNFCVLSTLENTGLGLFAGVVGFAAEEIWTGGKFLAEERTIQEVNNKQKVLAGCLGTVCVGLVVFLLHKADYFG